MTTLSSNITLDIDFVRSQFPTLTDSQYQDIAFFENAGGTYVPKQVINHLERFMIESKVQPYAPYPMSQQATAAIETATIKMAEMINANSTEVVIGHCTTMNLYMLSTAMLGWLKPGDEVIVTNQDHEANISPWRRLQEHGVVIKEWSLQSATGELDINDLEKILTSKTKLVCMTHSSNIIGSVNDVKTVANRVHDHNALLLVDGVSYAPHHAIDVKEMGIDIYALSLYKLFGPHLGLLYMHDRHHDKLKNQSLVFMPELYAKHEQHGSPNYLRICLNPGLVNHEETASLLGLVDYFETIYQHHFKNKADSFHQCVKSVFELIVKHETQLAERFINNINNNQNITLIGREVCDTTTRSPTYCLTMNNDLSSSEIAAKLSEEKIAVQSGCFYAWRCLQAIGLTESTWPMRISMAHFNSIEEVDRLNISLNSLN